MPNLVDLDYRAFLVLCRRFAMTSQPTDKVNFRLRESSGILMPPTILDPTLQCREKF